MDIPILQSKSNWSYLSPLSLSVKCWVLDMAMAPHPFWFCWEQSTWAKGATFTGHWQTISSKNTAKRCNIGQGTGFPSYRAHFLFLTPDLVIPIPQISIFCPWRLFVFVDSVPNIVCCHCLSQLLFPVRSLTSFECIDQAAPHGSTNLFHCTSNYTNVPKYIYIYIYILYVYVYTCIYIYILSP